MSVLHVLITFLLFAPKYVVEYNHHEITRSGASGDPPREQTLNMKWQCPACSEVNRLTRYSEFESSLRCDGCGANVAPRDTLCVVCDAPNPWTPRDSVHFWCTACGETQTTWSDVRSA